MPNLERLFVRGSPQRSFILPPGYTHLRTLVVSGGIASIQLPSDLSRLRTLRLGNTRLTDLVLLQGLHSLESLAVNATLLHHLQLSPDARKLRSLNLTANHRLEVFEVPQGVGVDAQGVYEIALLETQFKRLDLPAYWPRPRLYRSALIDFTLKVNPDGGVEFECFGGGGRIRLERSFDLKQWTLVRTFESRAEPYWHRIHDMPGSNASRIYYRVQHIDR